MADSSVNNTFMFDALKCVWDIGKAALAVTSPPVSPRRILTAAHPSPLSVYRGFEGCDHFLKCNEFLVEHGEKPVQWMIGESAKKKEPKKKETDEKEEQYSLFGKGKAKTDSEVPW